MIQFQLELVISDSVDVAQLEASTPALTIASAVWTYMTSHILVNNFRCRSQKLPKANILHQGIYPVVIVILVHSQRSYIDTATVAVHGIQDPSGYTSSNMRQQWVDPRAASTQLTHPIQINVIQLHEMHTDTSDDGVDESVILPRETKIGGVVP